MEGTGHNTTWWGIGVVHRMMLKDRRRILEISFQMERHFCWGTILALLISWEMICCSELPHIRHVSCSDRGKTVCRLGRLFSPLERRVGERMEQVICMWNDGTKTERLNEWTTERQSDKTTERLNDRKREQQNIWTTERQSTGTTEFRWTKTKGQSDRTTERQKDWTNEQQSNKTTELIWTKTKRQNNRTTEVKNEWTNEQVNEWTTEPMNNRMTEGRNYGT